MSPKWVRAGKIAIVAFLVAMLFSEALIYVGPLKESATLQVSIGVSQGNLSVSTFVKSTFAANFTQAAYVTPIRPSYSDIYYYYDQSYPYSFSDPIDWYGLSQHLSTLAYLRGQSVSIHTLNATALAQFVQSTPAKSEVLVLASGVLPSTVFTRSNNTIAKWVSTGGTMIWIGDRLGAYSGTPGQPLTNPTSQIGDTGSSQFFNLSLLGGSASSYTNQTRFSSAFGFDYSFGLQGDDWNLTNLGLEGGIAMGQTASGYTNIALLHLGAGLIMDFGGPTYNDDSIAEAILNSLYSGSIAGNITLISVRSFSVSPGSHTIGPFTAPLPFTAGLSQQAICVFTYQDNYLGPIANTTCVSGP